ncbi:ComEA family DNA-binding protein [Chitinimonas lacunae]|uniref:ComEA family DNA-binding protein n=1 Tax=Chitinimonas lacunae TaxID=1963018 RepID=A0ABV8MIX6_9NEIS
MRKLFPALFAALLSVATLATVNINSAPQTELEGLKGIGPAKARAIIDYRSKNGPFKSVDELEKVSGIGRATLDKIRPEISTGTPSAAAKPVTPPARKAEQKKP